MKAFVAITLLAACVAAHPFDYQTGHRQQHLLKREHNDISGLWKDVFGINKDYKYDFDTTDTPIRRSNINSYYPYTIPTTYNDNTWDGQGQDTLTLEEIIRHPLFQTYYTLPLFRQHFTHPLFRLYLTTPYFQQYWTQPIFTTFFRNPYLFNKYIYPIVYNTAATGVYDRENIFGDYKTTTTDTDTYPYGNKYTDIVYPFNTGYPINKNHIQYATTMDKFINKPEINQIKYGIQTPIEKNIFHKIIDPITGEIKYTTDDFKTISDKYTINHNKHMDAIIEQELKNILIKKIFLNKILYGDRKIDHTIPEIFKHQTTYPQESYKPITPLTSYETIARKYETPISRDIMTKLEAFPRDLLAKYTITTIPKEEITHNFDNAIPFQHKVDQAIEEIFKHKATYPQEKIITPLTSYETIARKYENTIPKDIETKFEAIPRDIQAKYTITTSPKEEIETIPRKFIINRFDTTIPRESKIEIIPLTKIETETIPITKTETETIPRVITITKEEDKIPKDEITHNKIDTITTNNPELTKKFDEIEDKIEKISKTEEPIETIRTKRDTTTRDGKTLYYYTPTHTVGHQVYTVPATQYQYVYGQQHHAQVPVTKTATTPVVGQQVLYNVPLTYTYGTQAHYTLPTTYGHGVQYQPSVYYPTQTYITA